MRVSASLPAVWAKVGFPLQAVLESDLHPSSSLHRHLSSTSGATQLQDKGSEHLQIVNHPCLHIGEIFEFGHSAYFHGGEERGGLLK